MMEFSFIIFQPKIYIMPEMCKVRASDRQQPTLMSPGSRAQFARNHISAILKLKMNKNVGTFSCKSLDLKLSCDYLDSVRIAT